MLARRTCPQPDDGEREVVELDVSVGSDSASSILDVRHTVAIRMFILAWFCANL